MPDPAALARLARELMGGPEEIAGFLALERGLVRPDQLDECLALAESEDFRRPLHEILVERGYLDPKLLAGLLPRLPDIPPEAAEALGNPARRIGKFALVSEIGSGAAGHVWKAFDSGLNRWVAIKILSRPGQYQLTRFFREAQTAAKLSHPGIVAVHEIGEHEGRPYIVMQLVEGQSLKGVQFTPHQALEVILTVAQAVSYAHQQGVIHRDLKPGNILRNGHGRLFVADFGLAREIDSGASLTNDAPIGTPSYMSPEQAAGRPADTRSDVYGLGATLYELLAGTAPFRGATLADVLRQVLDSEPASPRTLRPGIHPSVEAICLKAMAKEPRRRYQSAEALAEDVARFLRGEPVLARPPSLAEKFLRAVRRRVKVLAAAAVLAVLTVVVLARPQSRAPLAESEPTNEIAYCDRAWLRKKAGDVQGALDDFATAIRLRPEYGPAYHGRATVYQVTGNESAMLADLDQAIKRTQAEPQWSRAYVEASLMRGQFRFRAGDFRRAIEDFTQVLQWKPEDKDALAGRAECYLNTSQHLNGLRDLELLLRLDPAAPAHIQEVLTEVKRHAQVEAHYVWDGLSGKQATNVDVQTTDLEPNLYPTEDAKGSLVFRHPGSSSMEIHFDAPAKPWKAFLDLEHLSTMDAPGSFEGTSQIQVKINGRQATHVWDVGQHNPFIIDRISITKFVEQGTNTLEIRLVGGTTCYWLKRLDIQCLYPAGTKLPPDQK